MTRRDTVGVAIRCGDGSRHEVPLDARVHVPGHESTSIGEFSRAVIDESPLGQRPGDYALEMQPDETLEVAINGTVHLVPTVEIVCRVRSFEYVVNLSLASGHVLADPITGDIRYRELISVPWDMHQLLNRPPARELTGETYDQVIAEGTKVASVDPRKLKRYVRVVLSHKPGDVQEQSAG